MTRDEAIALARDCAKAKPQSYYAEPFQPHEWVIDAIMRAAQQISASEIIDVAFDDLAKAIFPDFGLAQSQEPKYTTDAQGRIVNRASGIAIPDHEPIMIFRAQDSLARIPLRTYVDAVTESNPQARAHRDVCFNRYQSFIDFADQHPDRMKYPDS